MSAAAPTRMVETAAPKRCACGGIIGADGLCAKCRAKKRLALRRSPAGPAPGIAPPIVHDVLRSGGRPLDSGIRHAAEARLGHDFGRVRVHTDARAAESAAAVGAAAYAVGDAIVFGHGAYAPGTPSGQALLRHELAHVLQHDGSPGIPGQLPIGAVDDDAEREADRLAAGPVRRRDTAVRRRPAALRRAWTTPQTISERRAASLPDERRGAETVRIHVTRSFAPCPCARIPVTDDAAYYNPDLENLAIAYQHCHGSTTVDFYAQLQSVAPSVLAGALPTAGTVTGGIDVNVVGRVVSGRMIVEGLGTQVGGTGIGGRATLVLQGSQWRVTLEPQFVRRLAAAGGSNANELQLSLGARLGPVTVRVSGTDLLDSTRGISITVGSDFGPRTRQDECFSCLCPAPSRRYTCVEDVLPRSEQVVEDVPVSREQDLRYYFHYNATTASEEADLRTASSTALSTAASQLRAGGSAVLIMGYASPEGRERRNADLSKQRAEWLRAQLVGQVGASVALPEASGAGELLGRRPQPTPSSRLGDAVHPIGFRSAEDLGPFLLGEEIPRPELRAQFVSLFEALDTPADRLAVFGLTPDDPIAPRLLTAIDQFLRTRGGSRPWEQVFRRLRYAVVRVRRTVTEQQERAIEHSGSLGPLLGAACEARAREAERLRLFGPLDRSASQPTSTPSESLSECGSRGGPTPEAISRGCNYEIPSGAPRRTPSAPDVAPRRLGP